MTKQKSLDPHIMSRFTGTEHWYRFGIVPNITCTDGAKYVADTAGAYWLLDEIALAPNFLARGNVVVIIDLPTPRTPNLKCTRLGAVFLHSGMLAHSQFSVNQNKRCASFT